MIVTSLNITTTKTKRIPAGAYNIPDIDTTVKRMMKVNGDFDNADPIHPKYYVNIEANYSSLRSGFEISNG